MAKNERERLTDREGGLSELLWPLYLAAMGWVMLPTYALVGLLLPLEVIDVQSLFGAAIAALGPIAAYLARRGGPLFLSEPMVLHGLRGRSDDRLLRRAAFSQMGVVGVAGTFPGGVLNLMSTSPAIDFEAYLIASVVGGLILCCGLAMTLAWCSIPHVGRLTLAAAVFSIGIMTLEGGINLWTLVSLAALTLVTTGLWLWLPRPDSLPEMWQRAESLASISASIVMADVRSGLVGLRRATDGSRVDRSFARTPQSWGRFWRPIRSLATLPTAAVARLGLWVVCSAGLLVVMPSPNSKLLAGGLVLLLLAVDATMSIDSLTASWGMLRSGRCSAGTAVAVELFIASIVVVVLAAVAWVPSSSTDGVSLGRWLVLALLTALVAGFQARLGSPDGAAFLLISDPRAGGAMLAVRGVLFLVLWLSAVAGVVAAPVLPGTAWIVILVSIAMVSVLPSLRTPAELRP